MHLFIESKDSFPIVMMSRLFEVSRSGYYKWLKAVPCRRAQRWERLVVQIKEIHEKEYLFSSLPLSISTYE